MAIVIFFITAILDIAADQTTKIWLNSTLTEGQSLFNLGFFHITLVRNTGSAFGLITNQAFLLSIVAIAGLVVVLLFFRYLKELGLAGGIALSLIFAGALGNLVDRLRLGYVTDFIYVRLWGYVYWPAFNVADSAITVGALSLAVIALATLGKKHEAKPKAGKKDS